MKRASIICAGLVIAGCGGTTSAGPSTVQQRDEAAKRGIAVGRAPVRTGEVVVRGDYGPDEQGPFALGGTYVARFEQTAPEDPALDFTRETAFTAHLAQGTKRVRLFQDAAREGRVTVTVPPGDWRVVVDFGDYPFAIRLTPR